MISYLLKWLKSDQKAPKEENALQRMFSDAHHVQIESRDRGDLGLETLRNYCLAGLLMPEVEV